jgi:hypothetical protein
MSFSSVIEVAIGLIFIYMLLSLVCSSLNEIFAHILKLRSKTLKKGLERLLTDDSIRNEFYAHPLVKSLCEKDSTTAKVTASYIPARIFATALIEIVASKDSNCDAKDPTALRATIKKIEHQNPELSKSLLALFNSAEDNLKQARKNVEDWFDDAMERVTGWYKKTSQWILLGLALVIVSIINVDTIELTTHLWQNPALRQQITLAADQYVKETESMAGQANSADIKAAIDKFNKRLSEVKKQNIPIGWSDAKTPEGVDVLWKIIGLLLTTLAVSLGAPFWFDLLNKFTRLRVSGEVPQKSGKAKQ